MTRAIFCKEWWKTRWWVLLGACLSAGVTAYILLTLRSTMTVSGEVETIASMLGRDTLFIDPMRYIPVAFGLLLGCIQWLPEMQQKRIKLTLHLPLPYPRSIGTMLGYGVMVLAAVSLCNMCLLGGIELLWLPRELVRFTLLTLLPYQVAGVMTYLLTAWVILEPTWGMRCVAGLMSLALVSIFFLNTMPLVYMRLLPWLIVLTALCAMLPLYSVYRFNLGKGL